MEIQPPMMEYDDTNNEQEPSVTDFQKQILYKKSFIVQPTKKIWGTKYNDNFSEDRNVTCMLLSDDAYFCLGVFLANFIKPSTGK